VRVKVEAKRPKGEEYAIDFGDLDPELVRALLKDGGRIWVTCLPADVAKAYYSRGPRFRRSTV